MVALPKLSELPGSMSADEFLVSGSPDGLAWQLVDGVPQATAPTNRTHGTVQSELARLLSNHFVERRSPCTVVTAPGIIPRVNVGYNFRIPDLAATCSAYEAEKAVLAEPVLLVEILSPSNHAETWVNIWSYTTIPNVQEILIVRVALVGAESLRRNVDGTWPDRPLAVEDGGELTLECVGFSAPVPSLYRTTRLGRR